MKMRRMRVNLPIVFLASIVVGLLFAIVMHHLNHDVFASSRRADSEIDDDGMSYVTFYDDDRHINVRTDADTVREALERADITLESGDKVEPDLDTEITSSNFNVNIYRAHNTVVIDGNKKYIIKTASTDPKDVAVDAGVELLEADEVRLEHRNNILESGNLVAFVVDRAETVHLDYYGKKIDVRTQAKTVSELLESRNIDINPDVNWVSIDKSTKIHDHISFSVQPQGLRTITIDEDVPFSETTTQDYEFDYGKREVTQVGVVGSKTVTYEVDMHDGVELSRRKISEIVTKEPVAQQVRVGRKANLPSGSHEDWMAAAGISPSDYGYVNYIIEHESHWNPLSVNSRSGATGVCQALPASKMASAGSDYMTNPITQLKWCSGYAVGRYGSWQRAYEVWTQKHWW